MTVALEANPQEALALLYAADLLYTALIKAGAPVKASEAARLVDVPEMDLKLARVVLARDKDRFTSTDRKWSIWSRNADPGRTVARNVEDFLASAGRPVPASAVARHLAGLSRRPPEVMASVASRMLLADGCFAAGDDTYGLAAWLLSLESTDDEHVLFYNSISADTVAELLPHALELDWHDLGTVVRFLDAVNAPVDSRTLQYLLWRSQPHGFRPAPVFCALLQQPGLSLLSDGKWLGPRQAAAVRAKFAAVANLEVDEPTDDRSSDAAMPLSIQAEEMDQLVAFIQRTDGVSRVSRILEDVFEVTPLEATYENDHQTVLNALKAEERVVWVGADRFVPAGAIPGYVYTVPAALQFHTDVYLNDEGDEIDALIEYEGLGSGLDVDIMTPQAQDVLDEEVIGEPDPNPAVTVRCVLKAHHKGIGTFPLCQFPVGFFPVDAPVVQVAVEVPNGQVLEAWVNNENRLMYGLLDWYETLAIDSGAVFYVERLAPDRYVLTCGDETEPAMFVSRNRVNELLELAQRAEDEALPTFEILKQILEHYRKGIEYITALTEVNIVRRCTRGTVASLLSGYQCFFQRGKLWVFDARKEGMGFDRSKRKYLIKRQ